MRGCENGCCLWLYISRDHPILFDLSSLGGPPYPLIDMLSFDNGNIHAQGLDLQEVYLVRIHIQTVLYIFNWKRSA